MRLVLMLIMLLLLLLVMMIMVMLRRLLTDGAQLMKIWLTRLSLHCCLFDAMSGFLSKCWWLWWWCDSPADGDDDYDHADDDATYDDDDDDDDDDAHDTTAEDDLQAASWWSLLLIATSSMMMQRIPDKQLPCLDSSVGDDANDDADESYRPWAGWKPLQFALQRIQTNYYFVWIQSWVDEDSSGKATYMRQLIPSFAATASTKTKWGPTSFVSFWNVDNVVFLASCRMHERLLVTMMMMMTLCFGDDIVSLVMMGMMMLIVMLLLLLLRMLAIMMMLCLLPMGPGWRKRNPDKRL